MLTLWLQRFLKFRRFLGQEVWRLFLIAIAIGTLWFFVELSFVYILRGFLSTLGLAPLEEGRLAEIFPKSVIGASLTVVLFGAVRAFVIFARLYSSLLAAQAFQRHQRTIILQLALTNAQKVSTPEIITLFNDRVAQSSQVVQGIVYLINLTTALILLSIAALYLAPYEFLIAFSILGILLWPFRLLNRHINRASEGLIQESSRSTRSIILGLKNQLLLRVYGVMNDLIARGTKSLRDYELHYRTYVAVAAAKSAAPHLIGVIAVGTVTFISLSWLGTPGVTLLAFFYLFFRIAQSASEILTYFNDARVHLPGLKILYHFNADQIFNQVVEPPVEATGPTLHFNEIRAENLGYAWSEQHTVFRDLKIHVKRGETLLIKGESGAGKSTLLSVLTRLLPPTSGKLLFDGHPGDKVPFHTLSKQIGYVGPEPYLIEGTVRDNLLFAHPDPSSVSEEELQKALMQVQLAEDIRSLEHGLSTSLNEFAQLSTGQKQRLSLARALLRKPRLLVLDEATANLDAETEQRIIESLRRGAPERITVIVSHRTSFDHEATLSIELKRIARESSPRLGQV